MFKKVFYYKYIKKYMQDRKVIFRKDIAYLLY